MEKQELHDTIDPGGMTFGQLYESLPRLTESKLPSAKYLRQNIRVLWQESIGEKVLTVYEDGHFSYSDGKTITVQSISHCARPMKYRFLDNSVRCVSVEEFWNEPCRLRLCWEGEMRLEGDKNSAICRRTWSADSIETMESVDYADPDSDFAEKLIDQIQYEEDCVRLYRSMNRLTRRQYEIVMMYYARQMTQQEIGEKLGCSRQRVSWAVKAAIKKLKKNFSIKGKKG